MEVSSQPFGVLEGTPAEALGLKPARKEACRLPVRKAAIADEHAPSVTLPLRFVLTGLLALFAGVGFLVARPDILSTYHYNQYVIAVTHLFVLGWICSIVMGAMYQLVPVALETRLFSERLARWHFVLHLIGWVGMVWMFWVWNMKEVGHFGSAFGLGVIFFVYNIGRTLARIPRWNVIAAAVASACFWLLITMLAGLYLASAKCWPQINLLSPIPQMHAHAHLGGIGFFLVMIVGVSYKLLPMFALSDVQSNRRAWWSIGLINVGLLGLVTTIALASPWKLAFAVVIVAGLAVYGIEVRAILKARKRVKLDWGLKYFLTAISLLAPLSVLALVLSWPGLPVTMFLAQLENVYGFAAFIGVVTFAILGMLYKIIPFLVWYASYSKQIGRAKVPSLGDMYSPRIQAAGYWTFLAGFVAVCVTTAMESAGGVRWGSALLAVSLAIFAVNAGLILRHLIRPRVEPLVVPPQTQPSHAN